MKAASRECQSLYRQKDRLVLIDGVLYQRFDDGSGVLQQLVIPFPIMRRVVLQTAHDHPSSGHLGVHKTACRIRQNFYWPDFKTDVKIWCAGCSVCRSCSNPNPSQRAPMKTMQVRKFESKYFRVGSIAQGRRPLESVRCGQLGPVGRTVTE